MYYYFNWPMGKPAEQLGLPGFLDGFRIQPVERKLILEVYEEDIEKG